MVKESEVLKSIRNVKLYVPEVICVIRIFTGIAKSQFSQAWIHGADAGTPDLCILIKYGDGHAVFCEVKRSKGGNWSTEQRMFANKIQGMKNIHYVLARSLMDVVYYIKENITGQDAVGCLK